MGDWKVSSESSENHASIAMDALSAAMNAADGASEVRAAQYVAPSQSSSGSANATQPWETALEAGSLANEFVEHGVTAMKEGFEFNQKFAQSEVHATRLAKDVEYLAKLEKSIGRVGNVLDVVSFATADDKWKAAAEIAGSRLGGAAGVAAATAGCAFTALAAPTCEFFAAPLLGTAG